MTASFWILWTENGAEQRRGPLGPGQCARFLHMLNARLEACPAIVNVSPDFEAAPTIGIGLGRGVAVVTFQNSLDPPYFISVGGFETSSETYEYAGEETEYRGSNLVPVDLALAATDEFLQTLARPSLLDWEKL